MAQQTTLTLTVTVSNDEAWLNSSELSAALGKLAERVLYGAADEDESGTVLDTNGNNVGSWKTVVEAL